MNRPDSAPTALFAELLGEAVEQLPTPVQRLHRHGSADYRGEVEVQRGTGWLSLLFGWAARLPPTYRGPIRVSIETDASGETWTRRFGRHTMRSRLRGKNGLLLERLGAAGFAFRLQVENGELVWHLQRVSALGITLPIDWFSGVTAVESMQGGRYHFDVGARLPWVGPLVHYRGWLDVD